MADLKSTLAATSADKERFFQEKLDLHQKLQTSALDKEVVHKEKLGLEDQVTTSSLTHAQLRVDVTMRSSQFN